MLTKKLEDGSWKKEEIIELRPPEEKLVVMDYCKHLGTSSVLDLHGNLERPPSFVLVVYILEAGMGY